MEPLFSLLERLLRARSLDEVVVLAETNPEALSREFFDVMSDVVKGAVRQGDVELAARIEQLAPVLAAMRGQAPADASRLFAALSDVRVLAELADDASWPGWARILAANPFLHSADFINHLISTKDAVCDEDQWVLGALVQLLVQCHEEGVAATVPRWASTSTAGAAAFLPAELQLAGLEHFAELLAPRQDLMTAEAFGNLGKMLYHRRLGDRAENLGRAEQALRASIALAEAGGDVMMRANSQQALVNVVLGLNETDRDNAQAALGIATEALEGWDHDSDPALWGLLMTSRANCLRTLRRTDEAIDSYHRALTVFPREKDARRWGIAMFGLGSAYLDRARTGRDDDVDRAIECLGQAAEVRTREANEARWAMTVDALGWAHFTRRTSEDLEKAAGYFRDALEAYAPGGMQRAQTLSGLGQVLLKLGRNRDDLITAKELLEQSLEAPGPPNPVDAHRALARVCRRLDESDPAAAEHQQRAIDLSTPDSSAYVGDVLLLASYLSFGQQVDGYVRAIARLTPLLPETSGVMRATVLLSLGTLHANNPLGDRAENSRRAMECYQTALAESGDNTEPWLWSQLHCMIASLIIERESRYDEYDDEKRQRRDEVFRLLGGAMDAAVRDGNDEGINNVRRMLIEARSAYEDGRPVDDLEAVRDHYRARGEVVGFARMQFALAKAYGSRDRRAVWAAETARRLLPMSTFPVEFGWASEHLGFVLVQQGEQERGGHAYHDAVRARHLALRLARLPSDEHRVRASFRGNLAEQACFAFARAAEHETDQAKRRALTVLAVESLDEGRMRGFAEFEAAHLDEVARVDPELARSYEEALARLRACTRVDRAVVTGRPGGSAAGRRRHCRVAREPRRGPCRVGGPRPGVADDPRTHWTRPGCAAADGAGHRRPARVRRGAGVPDVRRRRQRRHEPPADPTGQGGRRSGAAVDAQPDQRLLPGRHVVAEPKHVQLGERGEAPRGRAGRGVPGRRRGAHRAAGGGAARGRRDTVAPGAVRDPGQLPVPRGARAGPPA